MPVFKQIIDGGRVSEKAFLGAEDKFAKIASDTSDKPFITKYREQFGEELSGKIDASHKNLDLNNYKQSPQEQAITDKLVKHQEKLFDIMEKYDKLAGDNPMTPEMKKQMNDEVTEAYKGNIKGDKLGTYAENSKASEKAFLDNVYDYPKKGTPITPKQRETVFKALEKDILEHDTGKMHKEGKAVKPPKFRNINGTEQPYSDTTKFYLDHLLDSKIKSGKIYIDEVGKIKMNGLENEKLETVEGAGTNTKPTTKIYFDELLPSEDKQSKVYTFLPLLHLENQRKLDLLQEEHFGPIEVQIMNRKFV